MIKKYIEKANFEDVHNSGEGVSHIIETSSGEYIVVRKAEITDTVGTDAPQTDESLGTNVWVMKSDKNLTHAWSRSYGSSKNYSGNNAWVFMIDKNSGDMIWDEVHGGSETDSFSFIFEGGNGFLYLRVGPFLRKR